MKTSELFIIILFNCFLHSLPVSSNRISLLETWKEINSNYANDIQESTHTYKQLKAEQQAIAQLQTIVERHLRTKNAELLVNIIGSYNSTHSAEKLRSAIKYIMENYDKQLIENIFSEVINEIVLMKKLTQLPEILWSLYEEGNGELFELMLSTQIAFFSNLEDKQINRKREFLNKYAYRLYKIKQEPMYSNVSLNLKSNVDKIAAKLPDNLRYLFFAPYFCLKNAKYLTFAYTAVKAKVDQYSRYIWLWFDTPTTDDTSYIKAEISENNLDDEPPFKLTLMGTKYNMYYYMMPNTNVVAGWESTTSPKNHIWNIEFVNDDSAVFTQNNHLMCAIGEHNKENRNIGGVKKEKVAECQWFVVDCDHRF